MNTREQALSLLDLALSCQKNDGGAESLDKAVRIFREIEARCRDRENNGYYEGLASDWGSGNPRNGEDPAKSCGSSACNGNKDGDKISKDFCKSTETHLRILEAYTALYKVWKAPELETRLRSLIFIFTNKILNPEIWHLMSCFNEVWDVTDSSVSCKRDTEAGNLLIEAAEALEDEKVTEGVRKVARKIIF